MNLPRLYPNGKLTSVHRDLEFKILAELLHDGRASLNRIAKRIGISTTTASQRLKRLLEQGIIRRFKPELDYEKLGYDLTAIIQVKVQGQGLRDFIEELRGHRCLTHIYEITGPFDFLLIGKFRNRAELNAELARIQENPIIRETNTSVVLEIVEEGADLDLRPARTRRASA